MVWLEDVLVISTIALAIVTIGLALYYLYTLLHDTKLKKGDTGAKLVSAKVTKRFIMRSQMLTISQMYHCVEIEYNGVYAVYMDSQLYNRLEVGSHLQVHYVTNAVRGDRLVLDYEVPKK